MSLLRGGQSAESSGQGYLPPKAARFLGQMCSEIGSQRGPWSPSPRAARELGVPEPSPQAARGLGVPEPSPRAARGLGVPEPSPWVARGLGVPARCPLPRTDRPTSLSHWSHAPSADEPKRFSFASSDVASAASGLSAFAHPPPPHLLHPSEVNSSENFPWEQFPLLIMPAAPAQLLLSGSRQQGRRLTLAWNSRGDGGGGADSWDYDKGWQAVWYASPGHTLSLPYWGDKDDFPCWSLSAIKTKHSNAALRFKLPPPQPSTRYHLLQRKLNLLI